MSTIAKACEKAINEYVERFDGNWKEVRVEVLRDIDLLFSNGSDGSRLLAYALDNAYHAMKPKGSP